MPVPPGHIRLLRFGVFEADLHAGELRKSGRRLPVHEQAFQVLITLLRHPDEVVTREQLKQELWPADTFVEFDKSLNTIVSKLREVLGDSATSPRFIETLPRRGYRFVATVVEISDATAGQAEQKSLPGPGNADSGPVPPGPKLLWPRVGWIAAAVVALIGASWYVYSRAAYFALPEPANITKFSSIAVLPFVNMSSEPEQDFFSDGLTDELIHALAQVQDIDVTGRTSSFRFKGKVEDLRQVGAQLKVRFVLEGSVRRSGNRVRITVRLVDTTNNHLVWSETYEREIKEIFAVQEDVSRSIAGLLRVKLANGSRPSLLHASTQNVEAHISYLKGGHFQRLWDVASQKKAIEYFEQSIVLDPEYAAPVAGLGHSLAFLDILAPGRGDIAKGKAAVRKALRMLETLAGAHRALAFIYWAYDWDWVGAEREYRRAVELSPGDADVHMGYGNFLAQQGRRTESARELRRALELDPLSPATTAAFAGIFEARQEQHLAIAQYEKALELDPNYAELYGWLAQNYLALSDCGGAIAAMHKYLALRSGDLGAKAALAWVHTQCGNKAEARKMLQELLHRPKDSQPVTPFEIARLYIGLGDRDRALDWLYKAYRERQGNIVWLKVAKEFDSLRSELRFVTLLRKLRLDRAPGAVDPSIIP
jgi:TolB-like protein/DNA-binding winged helix-turn-helix (wHTH) protein/Tfp pilus assembly protein PilF